MNLSAGEITDYFFTENPSPMVVFDLETLEILVANKAASAKYGYSKEEFMDMNVKGLHSKDEVPVFLEHLKGIDKKMQNPYHRHQKKGGDTFYAQVSSRNFIWGNQNAQLAVIHDVSDQVEAQRKAKKAEKEAREERKFSSLLIKNLPDAFWLMDENGNTSDWNLNLQKVTGLNEEEIKGRFILDFFAAEERADLEQALSKAFEEGQATAEGTLVTKNGEYIPHALTGIKFTYHDEPFIAGIGVNISNQKEYQQQIEESRENLNRAQEIASIGSWEMGFSDLKPKWSDQMYNIVGVTRDSMDLSIENFMQFVHSEDRPGLQKYIDDAISGELNNEEFEHRIITANGDVRHVIERGEIDFDEKGNPLAMSGTMQDITERKKNEQKLQDSLREKEILLAEIHHRVKNNLAVISGLLKLEAMQWNENMVVQKVLNESQLRIKSMAMIHERLYEAGDFSNLNLQNYITELVDDIHQALHEDGQKVDVEIDSDDIYLNINHAIPCALLINELVTNAFKYAFNESEGGILKIRFEQNGDLVVLTVHDNGPGLPDDFEPNSTDSLGYILVNQLTKQLSGKLQVEDRGGACINVKFLKGDKSGSSGNKSLKLH